MYTPEQIAAYDLVAAKGEGSWWVTCPMESVPCGQEAPNAGEPGPFGSYVEALASFHGTTASGNIHFRTAAREAAIAAAVQRWPQRGRP